MQAPRCLSLDSSRRTLDLLAAIPNGVTGMSRDIAGLVESSTNLGVVKTDGGTVRLVFCSRSSVMSTLDGLVRQHAAIGALAGAETSSPRAIPAGSPTWPRRCWR